MKEREKLNTLHLFQEKNQCIWFCDFLNTSLSASVGNHYVQVPKQKGLIRGGFEHQSKAGLYFLTKNSGGSYLWKTDTETFHRTAVSPQKTFLEQTFTAGT